MQARWSDICFEMDEELKKTIETPSASVKTIKADLLTLKRDHEVTRSDNNSQAGLQSSDIVSGSGPAKKRKRTSEAGFSEELATLKETGAVGWLPVQRPLQQVQGMASQCRQSQPPETAVIKEMTI